MSKDKYQQKLYEYDLVMEKQLNYERDKYQQKLYEYTLFISEPVYFFTININRSCTNT